MLFRFSLYGFLKNLRLFDAFLLLALRDRGLDFQAIGTLVAIRELVVIALEVPSGALADALGRRRCMVASMAGYVAFSVLMWRGDGYWLLAAAMACHGFGDAFRSGTHKAMILAWLRGRGRLGEKTRIYGLTRSWSQIGSACSALGGGALLLAGADYDSMFAGYAAIATLNLINLASYPAELDERGDAAQPRGALSATWHRLRDTLRRSLGSGELRATLLIGAAITGGYEVAKGYLQPLLETLAESLPVAQQLAPQQRTGVLVAIVSALLFVLSSLASRHAHRVEAALGGTARCTSALATWQALGLLLVGVASWLGLPWLGVSLFVALAVGHNLWRPVLVGRLGETSHGDETATVLSIESQASSLAAALFAPAIGTLVDLAAGGAAPTPFAALWPVGLLAAPLLLARAINGVRPRTTDT
ncbi:MAG: MFS transporter [Planctomycetota bacterium]